MKNRRNLAFVGLLAVGSLLAAACSDDDDSTTSSDTSAETSTTEDMTESTEAMADETIVEIAAGNPDFSTLVSAVEAAGLAETLSGEGPFTVFAPTNEAFAAIPAETLQSLLEPANQETLSQILTYHVVAGEVMAADVAPGEVETVEGTPFTIEVEGSDVFIVDGQGGRAQVVTTDIVASNGVIHVIDAVLIPSDVTV
jgi:uncharacterized surface protein with fasciclin (FAS1) repeats